MNKRWVQIATMLTTMTAGSLAAAEEDLAPPPLAVGGEGRWVFDLVGGQIGTGSAVPLGALGGFGALGVGVVGIGPLTIGSSTSVDDGGGMHRMAKSSVISLTPSVDTFVTERFSVGGRISAGVTSFSSDQSQAAMPGVPAQPSTSLSSHGYTVGIAPRIGYAIPISSSFAFWPRLGVGYEISRAMDDDSSGRTIERSYYVETTLGVGMRVAKHAFFDLGPVLAYRRMTSEASPNLGTSFGLPGGSGSYEAFGASFRASLRVDF